LQFFPQLSSYDIYTNILPPLHHITQNLLQVLIMSRIGSKLFQVDTIPTRLSCICDSDDCKKLTKCFQSINDARGGILTMPTIGGTQQPHIKEWKARRICHHLALGENKYEQYASVDKRNRSRKSPTPTAKQTRNKKKDPQQVKKGLAVHHFHPEIVQLMTKDNKLKFIDLLPESFVKQSTLWKKGYSTADKLPGGHKNETVYVPTPSYKHAEDDYDLAVARFKLHGDIIRRCEDATYGHSFLVNRGRGEGSSCEPVNKLPRLDTNSIKDLQRAVCMLAEEADELKIENQSLKDKLAERDMQNDIRDPKVIEKAVKARGHGLTRLNVSSDEYHKHNPRVARMYFKFEDTAVGSTLSSWDITKQFAKSMFGLDHVEPTYGMIKDKGGRATKLTLFETWLVTLIFFQNGYDQDFIGSIFGVKRQIVGRCIKAWARQFREVGYHMARHTLTKSFLDGCYPESYAELNFTPPVGTIVDGTDVMTDAVRTDRVVGIVQQSNKIKRAAARGCTWSTPIGLIHEFTDPFFARGSEKAIVKLWAAHGRLADIPVGYLVSADKGFDFTTAFYHNYNPVIHPAFLTKGAHFTEEQLDWNRKACEMRYTSEVVFSRVKKHGGLGGIVPRRNLPYLRDLWAWAHGMANYYNCLQVPANNTYFPESKYSKKKDTKE